MNFYLILLIPVFWMYFILFSVTTNPKGTRAFLTQGRLTTGIILKAALALAPFVYLSKGNEELPPSFLLYLSLTMLISPLGVPSPVGDGKATNLASFTLSWVKKSVDVAIRSSILLFALWLVSIPLGWLFNTNELNTHIYEYLKLWTPVVSFANDHFVAPGSFISTALIILILKSIIVAAVKPSPLGLSTWSVSLVTFSIGIFVICYLLSLTLFIPNSPDEWGSPVTGVFSGIILNYVVAYNSTRLDQMS